MADIIKPDYTYLWSSGGAIVPPSNAKIQTGWTAEVPPFQWENWSQNRQDQGIAHILQHGISTWDAATEYQANKSYVQGSDGLLYKAIQTAVNQNPVTDTSFVYWTKAASGGLLAVRRFTSNTTYTPTPGTRFVVVELQGGGAAGGGAPSTLAGQYSVGGGGGAGAYSKHLITSGFSGVSVTIGAGGAGASGTTGGNGGTTSFGGIISVAGGLGGVSQNNGPNAVAAYGGAGAAASATGNIINCGGTTGGYGIFVPSGALLPIGGLGAGSYFGGGGFGSSGIIGGAGLAHGAGGGGSSNTPSQSALVGGDGAAGVAIVWEYL